MPRSAQNQGQAKKMARPEISHQQKRGKQSRTRTRTFVCLSSTSSDWMPSTEQEINPVQIPHPSNATFKFPPPRARCTVKCPGYARGGMLKFRIDRRINWIFESTNWMFQCLNRLSNVTIDERNVSVAKLNICIAKLNVWIDKLISQIAELNISTSELPNWTFK